MEALFPKLDVPEGNMGIIPVTIQMGLYGYVLFIAADLVGGGAGLLMLCPSYSMLAGSIILPILGAVPDGMMVLCSGLGPREEAQTEVSIGVGALAGSTIMLLTLPWFLAITAGRVSIDKNGEPTYKKPMGAPSSWNKLSPPGDAGLFRTGVSISPALRKSAKIMVFTALSYLVIQGPAFTVDKSRSWQAAHIKKPMYQDELLSEAASELRFAYAGLAMCVVFFLGYLVVMYKDAQQPTGSIQNAIVQANVQAIKDGQCTLRGAMAHFREKTTSKGLDESLIKKDVALENEVKRLCSVLTPFFGQYDLNGDGKISIDEFRLVMKDLRENVSGEMMVRIFEAADMDNSKSINFEEFVACMLAFAMDPNDMLMMSGAGGGDAGASVVRIPTQSAYMGNPDGEEHDPEEEDMPEDLADLPPAEQQRRIKKRAFYQMAVGTALVLFFSDPMVETLGIFADQIKVPRFYVSFILAPLASNASELAGAMTMARVKTASSMTSSLSSLLGAGIMNNTFCLAIFLLLIIWKKLAWQFTAETISILVIEVIMAILVLCLKTQKLVHGYIILSLYPFALGLVYVLENHFNLD